jgi:hypothetical protein
MDSTYNLNGGFKPTIKRFADLEGPDFYPTPDWATYALIDNERFEGQATFTTEAMARSASIL